jgi:hypothetical protein
MKKISKYLKSNEILRFFVVFIPILIFLIAIGIIINPENRMSVNHYCIKINQTEDYCTFLCKFTVNLNSVGRVLVTHTSWSSIYESGDFNISENVEKEIEIQLPYRNFNYYMRSGFYNITNGMKNYGVSEGDMFC